ncbi:MAG: tRNA threonylcarbamoyladenosine biosynthesis protein TsaB [Patescibacteria group bacterium]|jgi:tRNA threonylcarbamoyladenosine biosynthesis protein TsaB|nr:tRNA threonylcarbamoyladenosine biosynthesis protein TsaB [Patescibacteria group bacterium]
MELIIDTSKNQNILIELFSNGKLLAKKDFEASFTQAERLLPEIDLLLKKINKKSKDLEKIKVGNSGGSFSALRIGIVTANTLAYGLDIPVSSLDGKSIRIDNIEMVKPEYSSEPNITIGKKKL